LQSTSSLDVLQDALCFPLSFETQHSSIVHQDWEKFSFFLLFSFVLDLLGRFWKKKMFIMKQDLARFTAIIFYLSME